MCAGTCFMWHACNQCEHAHAKESMLVWRLEGLSVLISVTCPRGQGCPGIPLSLSLSLFLSPGTDSVALFVSVPPASQRQGLTDVNGAFSFSSRQCTALEKPPSNLLRDHSFRGCGGYGEEGQKVFIASLCVKGRKIVTINPPLFLRCTPEHIRHDRDKVPCKY